MAIKVVVVVVVVCVCVCLVGVSMPTKIQGLVIVQYYLNPVFIILSFY